MALQVNKLEFIEGCFVQSLIKTDPVVLKKKIQFTDND